MKSTLLLTILLLLTSSLSAQEDFYNKHWSQVYKFEVQDLPKSALEIADQIYAKAKRDKNSTQIVKALLYQSKFALAQPDTELLIVNKWKEEIKTSQVPLKNILESVLANIYWDYFERNRWTYYNRSRTEAVINAEDFRTWDANAMFQEIHNCFQRSMQDSRATQAINLSAIDDLLTEAQQSKVYRPTLFDFLAHNTIDFYSTNESSLIKFATDLSLEDPTYFENIDNIILPTDNLSPAAEALKIFKQLFVFHQNDKDPTAFVNLKLEYFRFLISHGEFKNEDELFKSALVKLQSDWKHHPVSAQVGFELADIANREGNGTSPENQFRKKDALAICNEVIQKFGTSDGAAKCLVLKEHILNQSLSLTAEEYVPIQSPSRILVEYTNIDSLLFLAYKVTDEFAHRFHLTMNDSTRKAEINALARTASWKVGLRNLQDYRKHSTEVVVPPLEGGTYLIISYVIDAQRANDNVFAFTTYKSTNLSLIESSFENITRFQVVNRNTGRPLEKVDVHLKSPAVSDSNIDQHFTTDKDGFIEVSRPKEKYLTFSAIVTHVNDQAEFDIYYLSPNHRNRRNNNEDYVTAKAFLFTDRSIYRPGQTVYFKGILIREKDRKSSVVVGQYVDVYMEDVNGEEVGDLRLKTNTYGSFSGEFKLPASGITGEYSIYVDEDAEDTSRFWDNLDYFEHNEYTINVEEYKRPTFEVTFEPVKGAYKVNDSVSVSGKAVSFGGAKIDGGKITYHVKRTVRYPHWAYWGNRYPNTEEEEIVSGESVTSKEGEFQIKFQASTSDNISKDLLPVFHYEVNADVTDINGETRSASATVNIGYHSLTATLNVPAQINRKVSENKLSIAIENLNSQPVPAEGVIQIFKAKVAPVPFRERPWAAPDLPVLSEEEFKTLFPHDVYKDKADERFPEKGKLMTEIPFNSAVSNEIKWKVDKTWLLGSYIVELHTKDKDGIPVTDIARFNLVDPADKSVSDDQVMVLETNKPGYTVGDLATIKIGSASKDATITIDIDKNQKISKTYVKHFSGNSGEITIPITEDMEGGFNVLVTSVQYNGFNHVTKRIPVVKQREQIEIETLTFKDKLQPGSKETWSFAIKGSDPMRKEAEILASMYDASLDQFKPHEWSFNPIHLPYYYSPNRISGSNSFNDQKFIIRNMSTSYYASPKQYFDDWDWFGFSITNNTYVKERYMQRLYSTGIPFGEPSKVTTLNNKNLRKGLISGTITSAEDGSPLPGVNVVIKGTTIGTATDAQGRYVLPADKGDVVVFSFIGLSTAEAKVGNKNMMDVAMTMDVTQLSEVVVTALGRVSKKELTGAVSSILVDPTTSDAVFYSLSGTVAGVQITGMPGGTARIAIRGNSSLDGNDKPLYVVDGVIVESSSIDHEDLASIQVLKGNAATSIYGARAANGVIIITTKSGQKKLDEEMAKVNARKNFNETAFFFPHLRTDRDGKVRFTFTTPESLTRWKLQILAHTQDLLSASKTLQAITQKELMVTPNAPRFLRVDDEIIFSAKISNLTNREKTGNVALQLSDAVTGKPIDPLFKNVVRNQPFRVTGKGSSEVSWTLKVPSGIEAIQYKVVAKAGNFSDGEQNALPILSNRMLVTETLPMYVKAGETKTFHLEKLKNTNSPTLQHHQLTLEVTSNPAWYAIQALPYLMEFPHECAEQIFSRYYANALASQLANSSPKIKEVFDQWASSDALISNLEKNQELKSIIINETPWVREAQNETEQKKRIALLFDLNTMKTQSTTALDKLEQLQLSNGGFTWFAGGKYPSRYITQHVASGFGHLNHLNVKGSEQTVKIQTKAVSFLDEEILKDYNRLVEKANSIRSQAKTTQEGERLSKEFLDKQHINHDQIHYLYMRSFFPDIKINERTLPAVEYYQKQSVQYWKNLNLYMKGMVALVQQRLENTKQAEAIIKSLLENSIVSDEMGMYWKENAASWYWYESPIETQALLIEACAEILPEKGLLSNKSKLQTLEELKIWLLKNKQTSQWKTTKATTEAVYALLMNGTEWLTLDKQVEVSVGNKKVEPGQRPEAGTGYFKTSWKADAIIPAMSEVTLSKKDQGIAWAGLYWQYFEDIDKITAAETPLKLSKKVFLVSRDQKGELLMELRADKPIEVGSLLRVRIELKADRPMEFLHMKDMRSSGLEPVDVLSEYKWQEGLGYYQSIRDASMNFFFDNVNPGVYVFEYDLRVSNKGNFSNGIATIQCMYAPEFSSHSEGIRILVK